MSTRASQAQQADDAQLYAALGDATRLGIVHRMCRLGPASIVRLTEGSGVSRQAVSKHLRVLEQAGLVRTKRLGRETRWQLVPARIDRAQARLQRIARQWDSALGRLKAFVEKR